MQTRVESAGYDTAGERLADSLAESAKSGPELAAVVNAWPTLPEHVRQTVLTLVDAARGAGK